VPDRPKYVYVASSWRNPLHTAVCAALRSVDIDHYDFKDAEGFHWSEVILSHLPGSNNAVAMTDYLTAMQNPRAQEGFQRDMEHLVEADCVILVLPAGRSSHLEMGYAVGEGKRTAVLLEDPVVPDLMYGMVDYLAPSLFDLLGWLGVED
jgi:hypothetical protein